MLTGTHINYYFVCHRKLWLFAHGIGMEHTSDTVLLGNSVHNTNKPMLTATRINHYFVCDGKLCLVAHHIQKGQLLQIVNIGCSASRSCIFTNVLGIHAFGS